MQQVNLCFGSEHFQSQTSKMLCAPLSSLLLPPRSRGWSSAAGDQSQQITCGPYIKMEGYTICSASLIKRLEKTPRLLRFSVLDIPLCAALYKSLWRNVTWECRSGHESVSVRLSAAALRSAACSWGPNHSDLCMAAVLRLCLCTCASVCQANGFTGDGVGYLLPCVIECNDYRCCVMRF